MIIIFNIFHPQRNHPFYYYYPLNIYDLRAKLKIVCTIVIPSTD